MNARGRFAADISSATDHWNFPIIGSDAENIAVELEEKGYSKPRTIAKVVGVHVLPWGSVIRTVQGYVMEKMSDGWYRAGVDFAYTPNPKWLPATVLHEGETA